jgi:hypothetical protein
MRKIVARGALLAALIGLSGTAQAQSQGYRLLVERGVDAIAVRHILADSMGEPAEIQWISGQAPNSALSTPTHRRTIVVARPELIHAVGGSTIATGRAATDLARALPGDSLAIGQIN